MSQYPLLLTVAVPAVAAGLIQLSPPNAVSGVKSIYGLSPPFVLLKLDFKNCVLKPFNGFLSTNDFVNEFTDLSRI